MSYTLTFDMEDASLLYHTGMAASAFRNEKESGRFNYLGRKDQVEALPELALASPDFDDGSILWCATLSDAMLLSKIHLAAGYKSLLLADNAAKSEKEFYVVLSSWNVYVNEPKFTSSIVLAEFIVSSWEADAATIKEQVTLAKNSVSGIEIMGEPNLENHDDHIHLTFLLRIPGEQLKALALTIAAGTKGRVGYNVLADD